MSATLRRLGLVLALLSAMSVGWTPALAARESGAAPDGKHYFVVNLQTAFAPFNNLVQVQLEFPTLTVYQNRAKVFGMPVYQLRIGFYETAEDANGAKQLALPRYPTAWVTEVFESEYQTALASEKPAPAPVPPPPKPRTDVAVTPKTIPKPVEPPVEIPAPLPVPAVPEHPQLLPKYALNLEIATQAQPRLTRPLPPAHRQRLLYVATDTSDQGQPQYWLNLGFFETIEDAFAARREMQASYPNARVILVSADGQRLAAQNAISKEPGAPTEVVAAPPPVVPVPIPAPVPVAPLPPTPPVAAAPVTAPPAAAPAPAPSKVAVAPPLEVKPDTDLDKQAATLMTKAREDLSRNNIADAIQQLSQLLRLPPNKYSQDAQELIGVAHERAGETVVARNEYELYLKLYPEGEGADRVRQRLSTIGAPATAPQTLKAVAPKSATENTVFGSLSQYYYHGATKAETTTTTTTSANTLDKSQFTDSRTDQKSLITSLDLTQRTRTERFDNRFVVRDTLNTNYLKGADDTNRLYALYYELKDRKADYSARIGRQSSGSGGVLGRFDGVAAGYNFSPKWRLNVVGGEPQDIKLESSRNFYGTSLDMGTFAEHWNGSVYVIKQNVDGVVDRQAVGNEIRYFDPTKSLYQLTDYDISFGALNVALLQGTWNPSLATTFNLMVDHRKAPSLQLTNATIGASTTSIHNLLQIYSYSELQAQAKAMTATADMDMLGVTQTLTTHWQLGGSVQKTRLSGVSGIAGSASQQPTASSGNVFTYTLQTIGTALFAQRDISVFSVSYLDAETYTANSFLLTNRSLLGAAWSFDTTLSWYRQQNPDTDTRVARFSPTLRIGYKIRDRVTLEVNGGEESTTTHSPLTEDRTTRRFWSLGYRWDF